MIGYTVHFYEKTDKRTSAFVCLEDGKEVFVVELDGTISGSIDKAIDACVQIVACCKFPEDTNAQVAIGMLRVIKKLQEATEAERDIKRSERRVRMERIEKIQIQSGY